MADWDAHRQEAVSRALEAGLGARDARLIARLCRPAARLRENQAGRTKTCSRIASPLSRAGGRRDAVSCASPSSARRDADGQRVLAVTDRPRTTAANIVVLPAKPYRLPRPRDRRCLADPETREERRHTGYCRSAARNTSVRAYAYLPAMNETDRSVHPPAVLVATRLRSEEGDT